MYYITNALKRTKIEEITMIEIKNLSFKYGKKPVLKNISLQLQSGKIYGLLGENGVGKTTLLKIISGLQKPSTEAASFKGKILLIELLLFYAKYIICPKS